MPSIEHASKMPCAETDTSVACIQEVWQDNMEEEFKKICLIVQDYPYIAMVVEHLHFRVKFIYLTSGQVT